MVLLKKSNYMFFFLLHLFLNILFTHSKTHVFDLVAKWVDINIDGYKKKVLGTNGYWLLPTIRVTKGDRLIVNLKNELEDKTLLHFHGLFHKGNSQMDGAMMVTLCPISPGDKFQYDFTVNDQAGTFFYHSHMHTQLCDGMKGVLIIDDHVDYTYDEEKIITLDDFYVKSCKTLAKDLMSKYNPTGAEPVPDFGLINGGRSMTWNVEPNKVYLLRIINYGDFLSYKLYIEDHYFEIVEIDGTAVKAQKADSIYITVGQRYSVLVKTHSDVSKNFAFMLLIDISMLDNPSDDFEYIITNQMIYDKKKENAKPYINDSLNVFDDFDLIPINNSDILPEPNKTIVFDVSMDILMDGINYSFLNNITYIPPVVPTLFTTLYSKQKAHDVRIYGSNTNTHILKKDEIVDIVINNLTPDKHPFHLHGHSFQLIDRGVVLDDPITYDKNNPTKKTSNPAKRDVAYVNPFSYLVLRIKADNPGIWVFHCHIGWHFIQGMSAVFIEDIDLILKKDSFKISENHIQVCKTSNIPLEGNVVGNKNLLDFTGENIQPSELPTGFTLKGYFALVFSAIIGIMGSIAVIYYNYHSNLKLNFDLFGEDT